MSPLWRDQIRIMLRPDRVILVRLSKGLRSRVLARQIVEFADAGEGGWHAALATLAATLKDAAWQGADAVVILSNHFVRYLALPWNDAVLSDAEQAALLRHSFAEAYGEASAAWEFRVSAGKIGAPGVASGVERELLERLGELFAKTTLRLASVQPYLMSAFNRCRRELGRDGKWFVLAEPGTLVAARLEHGQWQSVRLRRAGEKWPGDAMLALEREALLAGIADQRHEVLLCAPEHEPFSPVTWGAWSIRPAKSCSGTGEDARYAPCARAGISIGGLSLDYKRDSRNMWWGAPLLAAGLVGALAAGIQYQGVAAATESWQDKLAQLERLSERSKTVRSTRHDKAESTQEIIQANLVIDRLALPWDGLLKAVDTARTDQVALLAIEPDAQKGAVRITAEAKTPEDMLAYIENLQQEAVLGDVVLQSHQIEEQDAEKPVRFKLTASWKKP